MRDVIARRMRLPVTKSAGWTTIAVMAGRQRHTCSHGSIGFPAPYRFYSNLLTDYSDGLPDTLE
jgi:hypothetical protein